MVDAIGSNPIGEIRVGSNPTLDTIPFLSEDNMDIVLCAGFIGVLIAKWYYYNKNYKK